MKTAFTSLLLFTSILIFSQNKRGLAYGFHSYNDVEALTPEVSWWYNWSETPDTSIFDNFSNYTYEFIPMTWNGDFNEEVLRSFLTNHPETKYLLAFNEPNFLEQADMTPSEVVALWPTLEKIADDFNLEIVSPAVNFCGNCVTENGTTYNSPFDYLDDFFEQCPNCRVDHIAIHSYMNTIEALSWYVNEFKKYNRPIWVTEFAGWEENGNIESIDDQINYMISAVDYLESESDVFRYAWFIGRNNGINNYPYIDILGNDGILTQLGETYKKMPTHNPETSVTIPAQIEAENYNTMSGIFLEKTSDDSGFANVSYIEQGDWLTYNIEVLETASYPINFRIAANQNTSFKILINGITEFTQDITSTGDFQNWVTFSNSIQLTAGKHTIKLEANASGFNINWFQIGDSSLTVSENSTPTHNINIYPNPFNENIFINTNTSETHHITLYNMYGEKVLKSSFKNKSNINTALLPSGIYLINLTNGNKTYTQKFIKN